MAINSVKDRALGYLQYGDRTEAQMRAYLKKKEYEQAGIEEAIAFLKDGRFIDDEAYCRRYIELGLEKRKSARRLMTELLQKGVAKEKIRACLDECLTPELAVQNALAEAQKYKDRRGLGTEKAGISKILQRLAYLGYEPDVIDQAVRSLKKEWERETDDDL